MKYFFTGYLSYVLISSAILGADYSESFYYQSLSEEIETLSSRLVTLESFVEKSYDSQSQKQIKDDIEVISRSLDALKNKQAALDKQVKDIFSFQDDLKHQLGAILKTLNQVAGEEDQEYIVQKGDSLDKIAKKFETTISKIKKKNSIKDGNLIRVGQKLCIPN